MSNYGALEQLLFMDKSQRKSVLRRAIQQYVQLLSDIGKDIYDSCIAQYYSQYSPIKYDRHGDLAGYNLYSAIDSWASDLVAQFSLQGSRLLPYKGKYDKRNVVLNTVLDGFRGAGSSKTPPGWPMSWYASYPNEFSKFSEWSSGGSTLDEILRDFVDNGPTDLTNKFFEFLENSI